MKRYLVLIVQVILSIFILPIATAVALVQRRRKTSVVRPAVLFGITPIINIKYWSQALRKLGYRSSSFVYDVYNINTPDDFDYMPERLFPRLSRWKGVRLLCPYLSFLWGLLNFDVFVLDFDGGFLRGTPLQFWEFPVYALAGCKIVALPYGSDVMDLRRCLDRKTKVAILQNYPNLGVQGPKIERRVMHYARWASFIVCAGIMVDFLPRYDLLVTTYLAIDTEEWRRDGQAKDPGVVSASPVTILHAPNHRHVKGTEFLVRACEELHAEGVPVELIIKERVPNAEVRQAMREADIVASAFIMGYYELFALEGMSMSKPVLNYWNPDLKFIYSTYSYASECPIVDASVDNLKEKIKMLVEDPAMRLRLGETGRRYVEKYHSYEAIGQLLDRIVRKVWRGEVVDFSPFSRPYSSPSPGRDQ